MPIDGAGERDEALIVVEAMDGMVRIALHPNGRFESIDLDPRVKRHSVADLADAIRAAMTEAQEDVACGLRAAHEASLLADVQTAERRAARLAEIHAEYRRQTAE